MSCIPDVRTLRNFVVSNMIEILENRRERVKKVTSKSLQVTFLLINLGMGVNLGFLKAIKDKRFRLLAACVSVVMALSYISTLLCFCAQMQVTSQDKSFYHRFYDTEGYVYLWILAVQYIIYVVVLVFEKYSLYDFLLDLQIIDEKVFSLIKSERFGLALAVYYFGVFVIRILCLFLFGEYEDYGLNVVSIIFYSSPLLCLDIVVMGLFVIYFCLYRSITSIKDSFENATCDVLALQRRYAVLVNTFDKIRPHYDRMLLIELMTDLPKVLGLLWGTLVYIKLNAPLVVYVVDYLYTVHIMVQIVLPAWMAHKINSQVDAITLLLHERLMQEKQDNPDILRVLRYLKARPLDHTLWRVIPVDLRLPAALLSLCTTYFIVIIQFSHLYD